MVEGTPNDQVGLKKRNPTNRKRLKQGQLVEVTPNNQEGIEEEKPYK